jgi:hypothetical protein
MNILMGRPDALSPKERVKVKICTEQSPLPEGEG